jgi:hypothetical protein
MQTIIYSDVPFWNHSKLKNIIKKEDILHNLFIMQQLYMQFLITLIRTYSCSYQLAMNIRDEWQSIGRLLRIVISLSCGLSQTLIGVHLKIPLSPPCFIFKTQKVVGDHLAT